jgi:hypothetical protein
LTIKIKVCLSKNHKQAQSFIKNIKSLLWASVVINYSNKNETHDLNLDISIFFNNTSLVQQLQKMRYIGNTPKLAESAKIRANVKPNTS